MTNQFYTLYRQLQEYRSILAGAKLIGCFSQRKDTLHLEWVTLKREVITLEFSARPVFPYWFLLNDFRKKKKNTVDLFVPLIGHRAEKLAIIPFDRTIGISFGTFGYLIFEFYGTPNAYFTDSRGNILQSFENPNVWAGRFYPNFETLYQAFEHSTWSPQLPVYADINTMKEALSRGELSFNKTFYLEWLFRSVQTDSALPEAQALKEIVDELLYAPPAIYQSGTEPLMLTSVKLHTEPFAGLTRVLFDTFNNAVREFVFTRQRAETENEQRQLLIRSAKRQIRKNNALLAALANDLRNAKCYEEWERRGKLLSAAYPQIQKGLRSISLTDLEKPNDPPITIELQSDLSPKENIARYFLKARKLRQSVNKISERMQILRDETEHLESILSQLQGSTPPTGSTIEKLYQKFIRHGWVIPEKQPERKGKRIPDGDELFKTYLLDGRWKVWIAQNDEKNEMLTFTYARKEDFWFHARGYPGSHVILRHDSTAGNPPQKIIETVASFAAYFSKAKTSALVPVMMTRKKYVRKMKHGKPGQVVVEREEVLMVEPLNPENLPEK